MLDEREVVRLDVIVLPLPTQLGHTTYLTCYEDLRNVPQFRGTHTTLKVQATRVTESPNPSSSNPNFKHHEERKIKQIKH